MIRTSLLFFKCVGVALEEHLEKQPFFVNTSFVYDENTTPFPYKYLWMPHHIFSHITIKYFLSFFFFLPCLLCARYFDVWMLKCGTRNCSYNSGLWWIIFKFCNRTKMILGIKSEIEIMLTLLYCVDDWTEIIIAFFIFNEFISLFYYCEFNYSHRINVSN